MNKMPAHRAAPWLAPLLVLAGLLSTAATPVPTAAQERPIEESDLPRHVADEVIEFFNDSSTVRLSGPTTLPATRIIVGDVGALGGPLRLAGEIDGNLIVVNGDLELQQGAAVTGDVTVVGGRLRGEELAYVGGTLTVYEERLRYVRRGDRITFSGARDPLGPEGDSRLGRSRFTFRAGTNYNRVEGLPVMFGPIVETAGLNPLRVDGFGIWRSNSGLNLVGEELGYSVRIEQRLFARGDAGVGVELHSQMVPIESWGLSDLEASLATFLLHRDYRDYYDVRGWSGHFRTGIPGSALSLRLEYRDEEHRFAPVSSPWSIRGGDEPWRPQPLVGDGRTQSIGAELLYDTRNETRHPSDGWLIRASSRSGVGGSLSLPGHTVPAPGAPSATVPPRAVDRGYDAVLIDLRRYNRVSPTSRLGMRVVAGGSVTGHALPPQFQLAVGGEGSLPGHRRFAGDCGARSEEARAVAEVRSGDARGDMVIVPTFGAYGCDRIALFQMEYQGEIPLDFDRIGGSQESGPRSDEWDWSPLLDLRPSWSVSFNAGRGWALAERASPGAPMLERENTETLMDLGVGVVVGALGLYWAVPLDGGDQGVNFFVRLSQSF